MTLASWITSETMYTLCAQVFTMCAAHALLLVMVSEIHGHVTCQSVAWLMWWGGASGGDCKGLKQSEGVSFILVVSTNYCNRHSTCVCG